MSEYRRSDFYLLFIGVILGFALTSFFAPRLILWYSNPPYDMGVNCTPAIHWGLSQILRWQIVGMLLGAAGLWGLSAMVRRSRMKKN